MVDRAPIRHAEEKIERYKERRSFTMLREKNRKYFKKWLSQRLNESLGKACDTLADISDLKNRLSDEVEQSSLSSDMDFTLRIRDREAKLIAKIRDAMERLEDGTFGICEECGQEIALKRLRARPVATLCIKCKKGQEAEERKRAITTQIAY